jgi:hypothetical protein
VHPVRHALPLAAALVVALAGAPEASAEAIVDGRQPTSVETIRPGVTYTRWTMRVRTPSGGTASTKVWRVAWRLGDPHVRLDAMPLGRVGAGGYITMNRIRDWASWAKPQGFVAAMNGDFFANSWNSWSQGRPSGMLVHDRTVITRGWGGPAAGFSAGGRVKMGRPRALLLKLNLPTGDPTVGAWNAPPAKGDQVGIYNRPGRTIVVPSGYVAVHVRSPELLNALRGTLSFKSAYGLGPEKALAFRFADGVARAPTVSAPLGTPAACRYQALCPAGARITVRSGASLIVARASGLAGRGLARIAAAATPTLTFPGDIAGWKAIDDVTSGKPRLLRAGIPIASRPPYLDDWQWSPSHWRPALATTRTHGWLIVTGNDRGGGVTAKTWAAMLDELGARDAMGFDNNSSTTLHVPGQATLTAFDWERPIPTATTLSYTP